METQEVVAFSLIGWSQNLFTRLWMDNSNDIERHWHWHAQKSWPCFGQQQVGGGILCSIF